MPLPQFQPLPVARRREPFDHPDWIFEQSLFQIACEHDLEGIVAKHKNDPYTPGTKWLKIRNQQYSQWAGRDELFERERDSDPDTLWDACTLVCEDAI